MKIRSLVITGFGPYASRQVLDFEGSLCNEPIFVVTGNTGAGKTTIFDAIAFALYGEASGTGREGQVRRKRVQDELRGLDFWFVLGHSLYKRGCM